MNSYGNRAFPMNTYNDEPPIVNQGARFVAAVRNPNGGPGISPDGPAFVYYAADRWTEDFEPMPRPVPEMPVRERRRDAADDDDAGDDAGRFVGGSGG